jgi:hypothetical protein
MNDTKTRYLVEPSPAAIARTREIISRFSVDSLPDLPDFACKRFGREIYCGASKLCADPLCEKK